MGQVKDWTLDLLVLVLSPHFDQWWRGQNRRRQKMRDFFGEDSPEIADRHRTKAVQYMLDMGRRDKTGSDEQNPGFDDVIRAYEEDR